MDSSEDKLADACIFVCFCLHKECSELIDKRKAQTNSAIQAIIREQHEKWKAVTRRLPDLHLNKNFFKLYLQRAIPKLAGVLEKDLK